MDFPINDEFEHFVLMDVFITSAYVLWVAKKLVAIGTNAIQMFTETMWKNTGTNVRMQDDKTIWTINSNGIMALLYS